MSKEIVFHLPSDPEIRNEAIRLQASIIRGDRHLFIVKDNDGKNVEVVHFGQLNLHGIETSMYFQDVLPEFAKNYPIGALIWMRLMPDQWEVAPVTTMDYKARQEYEAVKSKLFGEKREKKTVTATNFMLIGKNPREA